MQAQIQVLLVAEGVREVVLRPNTGSSTEVAKLQIFDRKLEKVLGFIIACRLFIRMRIMKNIVEKQIQWVLLYMQENSADV